MQSGECKAQSAKCTKTDLKALDLPALEVFVTGLGWERYRARQLYTWIWQKGLTGFQEMTNLAQAKRESLDSQAYVSQLRMMKRSEAPDRTTKFLFGLEDALSVETVFIPDAERRTVCVSTQVGCPLACDFCFTGQQGFRRNLAFHEIADQVLQAGRLTGETLTNVVMMGMGEPMLNLDEALKAGEVLNSDLGLRIGARRITISTSGIPDGIRRLADYPRQFKLAVSLNATDDETRSRLMPINRKYPLAEVLAAVKYYAGKTRKRTTFEYVLIQGVNDRRADAQRLVKLLKYIPCKVNLIPFNSCPGRDYHSPEPEAVQAFAELLYPHLPAVTIRASKGRDIQAACGQLAGEKLSADFADCRRMNR